MATSLARAMALLWDTPEHIQAISIQPRKPIQPSTPRRSCRRSTAMFAGVIRFAKGNAKRLGSKAVSQA
jgi:hypothetical protein